MRTLGVIGLGLIGGSLALAARQGGYRIIGFDRAAATTQAALDNGVIDEAAADIAAVCAADIVCLAVPMGAYSAVLQEVGAALRDDGVVTDSGSSKRDAVRWAQQHLGARRCRFVAAHPVAGKEESGLTAATADLFRRQLTVICPEDCAPDARQAAQELWQAAGARLTEMPAAEHDRLFAQVSHLPHVLAYAMVGALCCDNEGDKLVQYAAGGFWDFTRIAGSHPEMWRDICLANGDNILAAIAAYQRQLQQLAADIENKDGDALFARFADARELRRRWLGKGKK